MPDPSLNPLVIRIDNYAIDQESEPHVWRASVRRYIRHTLVSNQCYGNRGDYPVVTLFGEECRAGCGSPTIVIITMENLIYNDMSGGSEDAKERRALLQALQSTLRCHLPTWADWTIAIIDRCHGNSTYTYPPPS